MIKSLGRMERTKGFIWIPIKSRDELIGDRLLPFETIINGTPARVDHYWRIWSSSLKDKFPAGSKVQVNKTKTGYQVTLTMEVEQSTKQVDEKIEVIKAERTLSVDSTSRTSIENQKKRKRRSSRKRTKTSSFGSPGRIGHDSSQFYGGRLYAGVSTERKKIVYFEKEINKEFLNKIFCKSSENMEELPDNSIHLMVTSPPYNVGKEYDEDFTLDEYRALLRRVFKEVYRVLVPGGRACVNVANLGRKPYLPLHSWIIQGMLEIGFLMRGEVIWNKGSSAAASTAWGSWCSASNPILRDVHEYILIFSKDMFSRKPKDRKSDITRDEFLVLTRSVWNFPAESATRVGHPAPFPVELPLRLIKLYTFNGEVVLDPFIGSGATAIAALQTNRSYVCYDIDEDYVKLAEKRIQNFRSSQSQTILHPDRTIGTSAQTPFKSTVSD